MERTKKLVAYFSCGGVTARAAQKIADAAGADLFEIAPAMRYTAADLDWTDKNSRSTKEMDDPDCRPQMAGRVENIGDYGVVFVGFPIWWYVAPRIVQTFLESADFSGKTIVPFFTSGGSGEGRTAEILKKSAPDCAWKPCRRFTGGESAEDVRAWLSSLGL